MLIDGFTVGAQVLNFLVLVWLLKRFLYAPIRHAIDARESRIARELADAATQQAEARRERDEFQRKNHEFDQQRAALWSEASAQAQAERQRLLEAVRQAADAARAQRHAALHTELQHLHQEIARRSQAQVLAIARRALTDLADTTLEARMAEVFIRRLRTLDGAAHAQLAQALANGTEPALVRSAFEVPPAQRLALQQALQEAFDVHIPVIRFDTVPDVISGIELSAQGWKVAWSLAEYLDALDKNLGELLQQSAQADVDADAP